MSRATTEMLRAHGLLAILRDVPAERVVALGQALLDGGVRCLEVAFTDVDADEKIAALVAALPAGTAVGAGTVTTPARAAAAAAAGASFLVTPHVAPEVSAYARAHGLPVVCGAMTPTEIVRARDEGSAFVKLFPAGPLGPGYVRALLGPYPDLELFAVGGVGPENARAFLAAGATGLGIGGALTSRTDDLAGVTRLARTLVADVAAVRGGRA